MGGSFQRALLCDIRIAAEGTRFRLPEVSHGVIPDTGGMGVLYEMCGHGLVSDLVLTGRILDRGRGAGPRRSSAASSPPTSSTPPPGRWPSRSQPHRPSR